MTNPIEPQGLNQADYLKLFMQELTYQDPLKPVDNKEFMAQMAQFASLQQQRAIKEQITSLATMTAANQAVSLIGQSVSFNGNSSTGIVKSVIFKATGPELEIANGYDSYRIKLQEVSAVQGGGR